MIEATATQIPEFLIFRLVWMVIYWMLAGLALFVVIWWPAQTLRRWLAGEPMERIDQIIIAMAVVGLATATRQLLWMKSHFLFGQGDASGAGAWASVMWPYLQGALLLHIFGYSLHVRYAWNPYSRLLLIFGLGAWIFLGLAMFTNIGGWQYSYVWQFSNPPKVLACEPSL